MATLYSEYDKFAEFYDDFSEGYVQDIDLILTEARKRKSKNILELCCGTGRCCLALASEGYDVVGIDFMKEMIRKAENKKRALEKKQKSKLNLLFYKQNAEYFDFKGKKFDMIFSTWSSLQHLDITGREACYRKIYGHLNHGGVFIDDEAIRPEAALIESSNKYVWYGHRPFFVRDGKLFFQYYYDEYDVSSKTLIRILYQDVFKSGAGMSESLGLPLKKTLNLENRKNIKMHFFQPEIIENDDLLKKVGFVNIQKKYRSSKVGTSKERFYIVAKKP